MATRTLPTGEVIDIDGMSPETLKKLDAKLASSGPQMRAPTLTDKVRDWLNSGETQLPFINSRPESIGSRLQGALTGGAMGAGTGALVGGLGAIPGALGGALSGAAMPPHDAGDYAGMAVGGLLGPASGKLVQKVATPAGRVAASGLAGLLGMEGQHAASELANRGAESAGLQEKRPQQGDLLTGNPMAGGLSMLPPALMQALFGNKIRGSALVKSNDFANSEAQALGGPRTLSQMGDLETLKPGQAPGMPAAAAAGQSLPPGVAPLQAQLTQEEAAAAARQRAIADRTRNLKEAEAYLKGTTAGQEVRKVKVKNDIAKMQAQLDDQLNQKSAEIDQLKMQGMDPDAPELIQARADLRRANRFKKSKQTRQAADDAVTEAQLQAQQTRGQILAGEVDKNVMETQAQPGLQKSQSQLGQAAQAQAENRAQIAKHKFELEKLQTENKLLDQSLGDLRSKTEDAWRPYHPELRALVQNSDTPEQLIANLQKTSPEGVAAYRAHLDSLPNGKAHVEALQNGMTQEFFKQAYDPQSKTLKNAATLFSKDGPFSRDKVDALYGPDKGRVYRDTINDLDRIIKTPAFFEHEGRSYKNHLYWATAGGLMYGAHAMTDPASWAKAAGGFAVIQYPKLIKAALESPAFADQLHRMATSTTPGLSFWPRLAAKFKSMSDPVEE